jgi:hypothetical protein
MYDPLDKNESIVEHLPNSKADIQATIVVCTFKLTFGNLGGVLLPASFIGISVHLGTIHYKYYS